jgi:hypothetical protein
MSAPLYYAQEATRGGVGHYAGHKRLGPSFTHCGKRTGRPAGQYARLCRLCEAEDKTGSAPFPEAQAPVTRKTGEKFPGRLIEAARLALRILDQEKESLTNPLCVARENLRRQLDAYDRGEP